MNTHSDKTSKSKSQTVVHNLPKQESEGDSSLLFTDNRPESIAQRKLQGAINESPRLRQLKTYQKMADSFTTQTPQRNAHIDQEPVQMKGKVNLNDDAGLEKEADVMGQKALQMKTGENTQKSIGASGNQIIQRYLIVGADDYTRWYKEQWNSYAGDPNQDGLTEADLNTMITQIAINMINSLDNTDPAEQAMIAQIQADAGGMLRRQLKKWIEEKPGAAGAGLNSHPVFGRKSQTRAYENYKDLAYALLGWVNAKPGRRAEKALATRVQSGDAQDAISYHLDSILLKIRDWVNGHGSSAQIATDLNAPGAVNGHDWNVYQNYFNNVAGMGVQTELPASYVHVITDPQNYDVREKTGMLHDIMHYFMEKYNTDNTIDLVDGVGGLSATVPDPTHMSGMKREVYNRPENTQIRDNQKDGDNLVRPEAMPGNPAPDAKIKVSKEEQHDSYKLARSKALPMYGRHSFTAARMMRMVQQSGGSPTEISAMAWSIMSYWRRNYDHTSIPYHTLHEIMDFLPEFGGAYDVDNPHAGIDLFSQAGLIQSLHTSILAAPNARDVDKLIATDTVADNAVWFLANHALWANAEVMNFLSTTILPDHVFFNLDVGQLHNFFAYDAHTQHLKTLIPEDRRNYVDGVII